MATSTPMRGRETCVTRARSTALPGNMSAYAQAQTSVRARGGFDFVSIGSCGLDDSYLFDPSTLAYANLFYCNAYLPPRNSQSDPTHSSVLVDGHNAYPPPHSGTRPTRLVSFRSPTARTSAWPRAPSPSMRRTPS